MNLVGSLKVSARIRDGHIEGCDVALSRPEVTRLFTGRSAYAVEQLVPGLYALCAQAQSATARLALAAAQAQPLPALRPQQLWHELLHETLWRLLLDWPAAVGVEPARQTFADWRRQREQDTHGQITQALLDGPLVALAQQCAERLPEASNTAPAPAPVLSPESWCMHWVGGAWTPPERHTVTSIRGAFLSRVQVARDAAQALAEQRPYPLASWGEDPHGIAQALTARGVLTHAATVEDGRVTRYAIWAPTDHHFANAQAIDLLLAGQPVSDLADARQLLGQAVLALDPCLPYTLELQHA